MSKMDNSLSLDAGLSTMCFAFVAGVGKWHMRFILTSVFYVFVLNGCCMHAAVIQHEDLSRTYLYIDKLPDGYESTREVGGEHMDIYYFMLPEGCVYELSLSSAEGNAVAYLELNGETLWSTSGNTAADHRYRVVGQDLWRYTLSVMAHPSDTYTLRIYKKEKGSE